MHGNWSLLERQCEQDAENRGLSAHAPCEPRAAPEGPSLSERRPHLVVLHGGVVLRDLDVEVGGGGAVLQLQDVHGLLPLARGDGRLHGLQGAPGRRA